MGRAKRKASKEKNKTQKSRNKASKKKSSEITRIILLIFAIIAISSISVLITRSILIWKTQEFYLFVEVDNRMGFNISSSNSSIYFGAGPPGSVLTKAIVFDNTDPKPSKIVIKSYGDIKDWIAVSENNFIVKSDENRTIKISAAIPSDAELGKYDGTLKIIFKRIF